MTMTERLRRALEAVERHCRGSTSEAGELRPFTRDFGGMSEREPAFVLRPSHAADVTTALSIANEFDVPVSTRGAGHGQAGHCLGAGMVLDMRGLDRIEAVAEGASVVEVEAGATWRAVFDATFPKRRIPAAPTLVVNTTVGGTLSVGGVGATSFRFGPQVDNVAFLDVATLDGQIRRASASENHELFDAVRAGRGQCGVILRAGYRVVPVGSRLRTRSFVYSTADRFVEDVERVCADVEAPRFVTGAVVRSPKLPKRCLFLLFVGRDYEREEDLRNLPLPKFACDEELPAKDDPLWDASGVPGHIFFRHYSPVPESLDADPNTLHPWVEHLFDAEQAQIALLEVSTRYLDLATRGSCGLILVRRGASPAPLMATPVGASLSFGIGMFAAFASREREAARQQMTEYSEHFSALGGKRYLSGYLPFESARAYREHHGAAWNAFASAKERFDPKHLLSAESIAWADA